jgi:hypothetical protein
MTQKIVRRTITVLGSYHLSVALFVLMFVATWAGTLAQVELGLFEAQKKYFESWFYRQDLFEVGGRALSIWLPGGLLLMAALCINLVIGGILMLKRTWTRVGILVTHLGIVLLLAAGLVKFVASEEGNLTLYEGQQGNEYVSFYDWEIAIEEVVGDGEVRQWIIPQSEFLDRSGERTATFREPGLPFSVTVSRFLPNTRPRPKGPMFTVEQPVVDGFWLEPLAKETNAEFNVAGCYVKIERAGAAPERGILWGQSRAPMTVQVDDRSFGVALRKKRYPMPFTIRLDDFTHEFHPNTRMPRLFESDITVLGDGPPTPVEIKMNEPLRRGGIIVFQSSWGPQDAMPGQPLFSGFQVVRNPSDQWPLMACIVIAIGMLIHFGMKLFRYVGREMEARA